MSRSRGGDSVRADQRRHVQARETLERALWERLTIDESMGPLVTGEGARDEPFHAWVPYRQKFSPELVRRFLRGADCVDGPVLDPFSGSGTTVVTCAQAGVPAVGVEAIGALAWITRARFVQEAPPMPVVPPGSSLATWWAASDHTAHRAMTLIAAAHTVSGSGRVRNNADVDDLIREASVRVMTDVRHPLSDIGHMMVGDARALACGAATMGGCITSPPYLSRYDYPKIVAPMERLLKSDAAAPSDAALDRSTQVRAALGVRDRILRARTEAELPLAAEEAARSLEERGNRADAAVVRNYFADMAQVLVGLHRALKPGAPLWIVVGGADLDREYIPSDFIIAEQARALGFRLEGLVEARRLRSSLRKLGSLEGVSPRETIVQLRRVDDVTSDRGGTIAPRRRGRSG